MIKVSAPVRIDISAGWSDADPFRNEFGGAVLNGAINLRVLGTLGKGKLITSLEKVPANSGLGTSGALRTVYLATSNQSLVENKIELIKKVHQFENAVVGQRAGFQDQAAAIFGGVNYWEFHKDGSIHHIPVPKQKAIHLRDRIALVFTGDRHVSSNVHENVFQPNRFMKHIPAINEMKIIAKKMLVNIDNPHIMGKLISETWELQKKLHPGMESPNMKKLIEIADGYFLGARATGAGGGGCMIFYCKDKEDKKMLIRRFMKERSKVKGMKVLNFDFDYTGIKIENED